MQTQPTCRRPLAGYSVMSKWLVPMIGNLSCCNNIHWGNMGLCPCSTDVCWPHDIVPSKTNSNLNSHCQLTCDDWGTPNTKLKYCQCTSAALLCYQSEQIFYCASGLTTYSWWIWIDSPINFTLLQNKFVNLVVVYVHSWKYWKRGSKPRLRNWEVSDSINERYDRCLNRQDNLKSNLLFFIMIIPLISQFFWWCVLKHAHQYLHQWPLY